MFPVPDEVTPEIAAGALCHGKLCHAVKSSITRLAERSLLALTLVTAMTESYDVKKDDIIFVHTVAGGLGLLFTAYAKSRGATVIGTTSSSEKVELARSY